MSSISFCFLCCALLAAPVSSRRSWHQDDKCGVEASTNLIHHNPWVVYLDFYRRDSSYGVRCAGSLVDNRHIITAAHCIARRRRFSHIVAYIGEYDLETEVDCVQGICADPMIPVKVEEMITHEAYDGHNNDIAILRLEKAVPYTDFIRPICLPTRTTSKTETFSAAGWGQIPLKGLYSHIKKNLLLPFWDHQICAKTYPGNEIPRTVICAGGKRGIDTCGGDSGGPLTVVRGRVELAGVTSGGYTRCGAKGAPAFYTDAFLYRDWVASVIDNMNNGKN